jgi:hypothetical protein
MQDPFSEKQNLHLKLAHRISRAPVLFLLMAILLADCGIVVHKHREAGENLLTEAKLWQIHEDILFTHLYYADGHYESGLMLRWMPDSIFIQERGRKLPQSVPAADVVRIETITGNRIMEGIALGTLVAAGYFAIVRGDKLGTVTFGQAISKLLVPPAIIITALGIGSSMEKKESYLVPPGFVFDYEAAKRKFEHRK